MSYRNPRKSRRSVAILLAGPVFVTTALMTGLQNDPAAVVPLLPDAQTLVGVVLVMLAASAVGAVISIAPVLIGSAVMEALGRTTTIFRAPVFWGPAGGLLASVPILLMASISGPDTYWVGSALIVTGVICALLCRRGYTWDDRPHDVPLSERRSPAICLSHDT